MPVLGPFFGNPKNEVPCYRKYTKRDYHIELSLADVLAGMVHRLVGDHAVGWFVTRSAVLLLSTPSAVSVA